MWEKAKSFAIICHLTWTLWCIGLASGIEPRRSVHENLQIKTWMPKDLLDPDHEELYFHLLDFFKPTAFYNVLAEQSLKSKSNSSLCYKMVKVLLQTETVRKPEWTERMLNATGKPSAEGLLSGNFHALGNYDECLDIRARLSDHRLGPVDFRGRFVLSTLLYSTQPHSQIHLHLPTLEDQRDHHDYSTYWRAQNITDDLTQVLIMGAVLSSPHWGLCVPSECSPEQVDGAINQMWNNFAQLFSKNATLPFRLSVTATYTSEDNSSLSRWQIATIAVLVVIGMTTLVGTILDQMQLSTQSVAVDLMKCFSLITNVKKLFTVQQSEDNIGCIHGIRFLSTTWIVLGHAFSIGLSLPWINVFDLRDIYDSWAVFFFGCSFSVDTSFFISGFLMTHQVLKMLDRGKFNPLMMYLHRYIRLTPTYGLVILVFTTLAVKMGSGPFWLSMEAQRANCATYWWTNLLYVNNFLDESKLCIGESWYLACDFQLFLIGPFLVWTMWRWKHFSLQIGLGYLTISALIPGILTYMKDWPPFTTTSIMNDEWMGGFHIQTYTRSSTYIWGIIFGFLWSRSYVTNKERSLPKLLLAGGWLISASFCLVALLGLRSQWPVNFSCLTDRCYDRMVATLYATLARLAWGVGVSWLLFACMARRGGVVNSFLSWSGWVPLSRLAFCIYLVHFRMMYIIHMSTRSATLFSPYLMVYYFLVHLTISILGGLIVCLLFETPIIRMEKVLLKGGHKTRPIEQDISETKKSK